MWQIRPAYLVLWRRADEFICSDSRIVLNTPACRLDCCSAMKVYKL